MVVVQILSTGGRRKYLISKSKIFMVMLLTFYRRMLYSLFWGKLQNQKDIRNESRGVSYIFKKGENPPNLLADLRCSTWPLEFGQDKTDSDADIRSSESSSIGLATTENFSASNPRPLSLSLSFRPLLIKKKQNKATDTSLLDYLKPR